ncbi:MAG: CotH kinase family protein [Melioribacteraceae bacterium]|nr:CotH kinase family protein [Melioribacteraceae bacterium]
MKNILIVIFFFSVIGKQIYSQKLFINEIVVSDSDWIEIYNSSDTQIDLSGFYLTDDLENKNKWEVPEGTYIEAKGFLTFFADETDEGLHTNFKLSENGELAGLYSKDGIVIDSLTFGKQHSGFSFGRFPDGGNSFYFFKTPTRSETNIEAGFAGILNQPNFSHTGSFYRDPILLIISSSNYKDTIRYTTDGSAPTESSSMYEFPLYIDSTSVIRVAAFKNGYFNSDIITQTYFINENTKLPIISISTDPDDLWDSEIGIYVKGTNGISGYCVDDPHNWNQQWERPASIELFEADRSPAFKLDAGIQISGGCTRKYPQKSLAIYARSEYGVSKIKYQVFPDKPITEFNNLLLRNSGQDWWRALIRDGLIQNLVKEIDIDWEAYKPAVLFLNGEYWGIHGIREKDNEHYVASNHNVDPDNLDILSNNANVKQGTADGYNSLIEFIQTHDLTLQQNYDYVKSQMDIDEYLNYVITEIYTANTDWPGGNIKYWRERGDGNKWRWILYDTDMSMGAVTYGNYDSNTLDNATHPVGTYYANPGWSTLLLRTLLVNEKFKNMFIQKFASHLNTTFIPERVISITDSIKSIIEDEIPRHTGRWQQSTSFNSGWEYHINVIKEFAENRPAHMLNNINQKFGLTGTTSLIVKNETLKMGSVFINGVKLKESTFSGKYFKKVPIELLAIPQPGYRFVGWKGFYNSANDSLVISISASKVVEAVFEPENFNSFSELYINEFLAVNQNSYSDENGEFNDWIELYNGGNSEINIGGLFLTDDFNEPDKFQISDSSPDSTKIKPGEYLVLWADGDTQQGILHLNFKLSSSGEQIAISKQFGNEFVFIDTLTFNSQTEDISFGRIPDGSENREKIYVPSPGAANRITDVTEKNGLPEKTKLFQNYPNPFNPTTFIKYEIGTLHAAFVQIIIYDVLGNEIAVLVNKKQNPGQYNLSWNASNLASGIYYYQLRVDDIIESKKMVYLK